MYKVHRLTTGGWVILYHEGDTSRPVDGGKVYTHRQAAQRRKRQLNLLASHTVPEEWPHYLAARRRVKDPNLTPIDHAMPGTYEMEV